MNKISNEDIISLGYEDLENGSFCSEDENGEVDVVIVRLKGELEGLSVLREIEGKVSILFQGVPENKEELEVILRQTIID